MNDISSADGARPFTWVPWVGKGLSPLALVTFVSLWFSLTIAVRPETRRDPARQLGLILLSAGLTWLVCDWSAAALIFVIVFFLLDGIRQAALQFLSRRKEASAA